MIDGFSWVGGYLMNQAFYNILTLLHLTHKHYGRLHYLLL